MPTVPTRAAVGFFAGALSHIVFQGALGVVYVAVGLIPTTIWSLKPLPPFGVPTTVNFAFWAGLWGILFGLAAPSLARRFGTLGAGLIFGLAAATVRWVIVLPLKGLPLFDGFEPRPLVIFTGFHLAFGLGLACLYAGALALGRREPDPAVIPARR